MTKQKTNVTFSFSDVRMANIFMDWFVHRYDHDDPLEEFLDVLEDAIGEEVWLMSDTKERTFSIERLNDESSSKA